MKINSQFLIDLVNTYKSFLINKRIVDITLVNSRLFLFTFKKENKKLVVDLDNNNPHIGLIDTDYNELSLPSNFISKALAKGKPLINDIEVVNADRVIKITTISNDIYYHQNKFYLYIELINAHANIILTDQNNKIITAFYETNINAPRLIITNNKYVLPPKKEEALIETKFNKVEYQDYVNKSFIESLNKRKLELYGPYIKNINKKIKSLENKIKKIELSNLKADEADKYKEYGETILMNIHLIKKGDSSFNNIKLDPTKSAIDNANQYFNKYKKSKRTSTITKDILVNLNKELEDLKYKLEVSNLSNEDELNNYFNINKFINNKKESIKSYLPYYTRYKDVIFYYGHNSLENDYLTFKMFKSNSKVTFLHIKDKPSSHLIINIDNPSNEILDIACSLLLVINKLNTGEIMVAKRKDISRGSSLGKVIINSYKGISMHKINNLAYNLLKKEKRVHE